MKFKNSSKAPKYSSKRGINLINHDEEQKKAVTYILAGFVIVLLALAVAKFGVLDQFARVDVAEKQYNEVHQKYLEVKDELSRYSDVQYEYRTYSTDWLENDTEGKYVSVNRIEVLDLLENELMGRGTVKSVTISGETATIQMSGLDLKDISSLCNDLEEYPIVEYATLKQGVTEKEEEEPASDTTDAEADSEETAQTETSTQKKDNSLTFNIQIKLTNPNAENADTAGKGA